MQKQTLYDIKDVFLYAFSPLAPNEAKPIIEQLENIVEKINDEDLDTNVKLLEWSEKIFQTKVDEWISSVIALHQVELATKIEGVKKMLEHIFSLYTKLCDVPLFTQEVQRHIDHLEGDLKKIGNILQQSPGQGQSHLGIYYQHKVSQLFYMLKMKILGLH